MPAAPFCLVCLVIGTAALLALAVDWRWGEPAARLHPVVWMGQALHKLSPWVAPAALATPNQQIGQQTKQQTQHWGPFAKGMAAWCTLAAIVTTLAWALQHVVLTALPAWWLQAVVLGLLLKPLLAWRLLHDEVLAVQTALERSLAEGQQQLARLVSRDVAALDETLVAESAIESLAENLNDSVIAPLFWFCLLGLPGAALYRFANTADAMWGYRHERGGRQWLWAGKWAARADDVLSWLPARLTALLLWAACALPRTAHKAVQGSFFRSLAQLPAQARQTPSPNGGWPMGSMALLLGVQLRKPEVYTLNPQGRPATSADIACACRLGQRAVWAAVVLVVGLLIGMAGAFATLGTLG